MEIIQEYFKSKIRLKYYQKKDMYINSIREEAVNRINNRNFDYVISGVDINAIALAKNIIKEGKSCLLISTNDFVNINPNRMLSFPITLSYFYLLGRRYFSIHDQVLFREYIETSYENLTKLIEKSNEEKVSINLEVPYLLFHQKFYYMIVNNILMNHNKYKDSFLKFASDKVYFVQKNHELNNSIMREITKLTLENRDSFQLMNYCGISNIEQIGSGKNRIEFVEKVNNSKFSIITDNLVELNNIIISSKTFKKRKDKNNSVKLSVSNNPEELLKLKYSSHGYYFNEKLKLNSDFSSIKVKDHFPFSINSNNFQLYLKAYVEKYNKKENSKKSFDYSYFKRQLLSITKYFIMKFGGLNHILERHSLNLLLLKNPFNSINVDQQYGDLKIDNFIKLWSEKHTLRSILRMIKTNDSNGEELTPKEIQRSVDYLTLTYNNIDKEILRILYKDYGETTKFILKTGGKLKKNVLIGEKNRILTSQILFEINFLHLNSPVEFLLKRHNYSIFLRQNAFSESLKILSVFAEELGYNKEKYQLELYKLLAFKYLFTKYSLDF